MDKPLYIFDLDGTLALIEHRLHHIQGPKKDWSAFFAACIDDEYNWPVYYTLTDLLGPGCGECGLESQADVWIWSGRSDECRVQTELWLRECALDHLPLRMRKAGDHRDDVVLKREWLDELAPADRDRLRAVFEDRSRVVKMWRNAGIACFQVAPGDF